MPVFCSNCGHRYEDGSIKFCEQCGSKMEGGSGGGSSKPEIVKGGFEPYEAPSNSKSNQYLPGRIGNDDMTGIESTLSKAFDMKLKEGGVTSNTTRVQSPTAGSCRGCGRAVSAASIQALGAVWHPECFKCGGCGEEFAKTNNRQVLEKDGFPYCSKCYEKKYGEQCAKCGKPVAMQMVKALGGIYHPECFRCTGCNKQFSGSSIYSKNGLPYCGVCVKEPMSPKSNLPQGTGATSSPSSGGGKFCANCGSKGTGGKFCENCGSQI